MALNSSLGFPTSDVPEKPMEISGMGFYGIDALPVTEPTVSKH